MLDDNPLWYDYDEPDEAPSRSLLVLAGLFDVMVAGANVAAQTYWLPDRAWRWVTNALASYRARARRRRF